MVLNTHASLRYNTQFSRLPKFDTRDTQSLFQVFLPHFLCFPYFPFPFYFPTHVSGPLCSCLLSLRTIHLEADHCPQSLALSGESFPEQLTLSSSLSPPTHGSQGPLQTLQGMIRPGWSWCTTQSPFGQPTPDWVSPFHVFPYSRTWTLPALHEPMPSRLSRWQNWGAKILSASPLTWCGVHMWQWSLSVWCHAATLLWLPLGLGCGWRGRGSCQQLH